MSTIVTVEDSILRVTLNRPASLNALDDTTLADLRSAARRAKKSDVRAIVFSATGRGFCSGIDLRGNADPSTFKTILTDQFYPFIYDFQDASKPMIAAVQGVVAGAGLGLVLMCDVRLGNTDARFVPTFVGQGLIPDAGTTYFAERALGYSGAVRFLIGTRQYRHAEALTSGLLTEVSDGDLDDRANSIARDFAALPSLGTSLTIDLLRRSRHRVLNEQLDAEARAADLVGDDPEGALIRDELRTRLFTSKGA